MFGVTLKQIIVFPVALNNYWENWKNYLSKVSSWSNLQKDNLLYVEIKAFLLQEILYTG